MNDDVIPLNEIGKIGTVKVYNQAYVDKQQKRIEELKKENAELKEKNEGYCRSRDRLISIGFPTFKDCKEYAEHLTKAKEIIKAYYEDNFDEAEFYSLQRKAEQFLSEVEK